MSDLDYQTRSGYSKVARSIPPERRRSELHFRHHFAVAFRLTPDEQNRFLDEAVRNSWTVRELVKQIRRSKELHGPAPPVFGEALDFPGLRRAPINELGVVFLFALMSKQLGFDVEAVHGPFPDCSAKRCIDLTRNRWKQVSIEFEYASRNFLLHQHQTKHCDLIVCWIHDWPDCPLEVISLKDEMQR